MSETRSRRFRDDDVPGVVALFARAFGHAITEEHYRWKLVTRPAPADNIVLAVDDTDRPVFHAGGIPFRCMIDGRERDAMISLDVMTDPAFRRRGLLTRGLTEQFTLWRQAGVAIVTGLPNEQWGSRPGATGWIPLFPLSWLVWPVRPERALARRLEIPFLSRLPLGRAWRLIRGPRPPGDVVIREWDGRSGEVDEAWNAAKPTIRNSVVRNADWVRWRFLEAPAHGYRVLTATRAGKALGYAAFRAKGTRGLLVDHFTIPGDDVAFYALVTASINELTRANVDVVRALAPRGCAGYEALRRYGFLRSRHSFMAQAVPLDPALDLAALRDPATWSMAGGDFDVV